MVVENIKYKVGLIIFNSAAVLKSNVASVDQFRIYLFIYIAWD